MPDSRDDNTVPPELECEQHECLEDQCEGHESAQIGCGGAASMMSEQEFHDSLPEGHIIRKLMDEHVVIRQALDRLEALGIALDEGKGDRDQILRDMAELGAGLVASEPHHAREEEALFPPLLERGLMGPPTVMVEEHREIRRLKHIIRDEPKEHLGNPASNTQPLLNAAANLVVFLRQHIDKENRILYPMSLQFIQDEETWRAIVARSEEIGDCPPLGT